LVIVGEEVDVAGMWLTRVEYRGLVLMRHKVIGVEPKGVDTAEQSRRGGPKSTRCKVIGVEPEYVEPELT
jgi:hypothetical protein